MTVVEGLRRARTVAGVSLSDLAARAGLASSNLSTIEHARRDPTSTTIDRLTAALGIALIPIATGGRSTVAEAGEHLQAALANDNTRLAYRIVIQVADDLDSADPFTRALLAAEPASNTGTAWDAFLAAVTEWRLAAAGLPSPAWVLARAGDPEQPWTPPDNVLAARPEHIAEPFHRRGILVEADELAST